MPTPRPIPRPLCGAQRALRCSRGGGSGGGGVRRAACGAALSAAGGRPVRLACGHIFCEDCVAEWMQRERTCPLCRSIVRTSREHVGGDGATTLLPTVF